MCERGRFGRCETMTEVGRISALGHTDVKYAKRMLSGMKPTGGGMLHLGNLEGALRPWVELQNSGVYDLFCFVADWHALTTLSSSPDDIRTASIETAINYIAAGIDPAKAAVFRQSDVKEHAELHLLLSMITPVGWLERVPTYKDLREKQGDNELGVGYGLMGYPVLQTADIVIYRAQAVPVGRDQAAHLEISREIARRFNRIVGKDVFPIPEAHIGEETGEIKGLDGRKMSKSYGNTILIADDEKSTLKKINKAYTTPEKVHITDPGVPEGCSVCALRRVYDPAGYKTQWDECRAGLRGCGQSKKETGELINESLAPMRARRLELMSDLGEVERILKDGADRARAVACETMDMVRSALRL
jgi:tryptophanyl-tRNA synthetase